MNKRDLLQAAIGCGVAAMLPPLARATDTAKAGDPADVPRPSAGTQPTRRVRPGDAHWPDDAAWDGLRTAVGGRLLKLDAPFPPDAPATHVAREAARAKLRNAFAVGDDPALTQTSGWLDAWTSLPSAYAVAAESAADVAAAVNFARERRLRLVVKGGGHSYKGTSDAPDSLLVWTRRMREVTLHEAFVPQGAAPSAAVPAVTLGAGAMWIDAYHAVTTRAGRYVQGGGCTTVGVAGLVQSGGFGSFSKGFGTAAAGLLQAEVVTADGKVRVVNAQREPELFWALKGGGGGSLGVVTRLTLRTHDLPETFGAVLGTIKADDEGALRRLIDRVLQHYRSALFNPHWGEQIRFSSSRVELSMVFQGLGEAEARAAWQPFVDWVKATEGLAWERPLAVLSLPARHFWDAAYINARMPGLLVPDDRASSPPQHAVWAGDREQIGWYIHGYHSAWLPQGLLEAQGRERLAEAIFRATRHWSLSLHFNKGLAGAGADAIAASRDTATNPAVLDAFALAIIAGGGPPAYPGLATPDAARAQREARAMAEATRELLRAAPGAGAYVSESDYFQPDWARAFWGGNLARLTAVKRSVDPGGLFTVRHGVGSEAWSDDGFEPRAGKG